MSFNCTLPLRFLHRNPIRTSSLTHTCYMPHPAPWFDQPNNICWGVKFIFFIMLSSILHLFVHSRPKYFLSNLTYLLTYSLHGAESFLRS
jgi:hypothetical protein